MPHEKLSPGEISSTVRATRWRSTGSSSTSVISHIHPGEYGIAGLAAEFENDGVAVRRKG